MERNYGKIPSTGIVSVKELINKSIMETMNSQSFSISCFLYSREVGRAVGRIIALSLDLGADFFDKPEMLGEPIVTLGLLHYEGINLLLTKVEMMLFMSFEQ